MEDLEMTLLEAEDKMDKSISNYQNELNTVRTGRANASLLDSIEIDYYGVPTPVKQVSSITVPEASQLYIKPYDKSSIKDIEKAILASPLGLTPQCDSTGIRLVLPKMTEDRRKELVKVVAKMEEQAKVAIRNIRRDLNDDIKKLSLPEDQEKESLDDAQKLSDKKIAEVQKLTEAKNKDLMSL